MLEASRGDHFSQSTEKDKSFYSSPPSVSLPKGGGAIKGMGEKFAANPVTGTGTLSIPIATSPGRSGFDPQLSLSYDSSAGNGSFGFGWNLSIPSITRKTDKGLPRYQDAEESDVFILSGFEDLVPVPDGAIEPVRNGYRIRQYRPRVEGLFARIERWTFVETGEVYWRSISKNNITTLYGKTAESRITDPSDPTRVFSWLICESYDDRGNAIRYSYKPEDSQGVNTSQAHERNRKSRSVNRYLKHIYYGNQIPRQPGEDLNLRTDWLFEVVFDYGEHERENPAPNGLGTWTVRNDPFSSYRSGFEVRTYRLCQRVLMFHHFPDERGVGRSCLVRSTNFTYSRDRIYSFLLAVTQTGYKRNPEGGYLQKSLPPVEFTYSEANINETVREVDSTSLENLPEGLDGTRYQWVDLDGEGLSGILTEQGGGWFYKRNLSPINVVQSNGEMHIEARFAPVELVASKPAIALASGTQFLDLAGDGQPDLVDFRSATPGFYERIRDGNGWENFVAFKSLPVLDWNNPNLKFIDLDGDGHSDILITEDECFVWHPSLAEEGFAAAEWVRQPWDEELGPRIVFADGTQSIYLADMSGDGLTDIVRIRNGEVCYWPNLGYGRFGAKVTMDSAPWFDAPDIFDQRRIQLADIDGSGTTDILYLSGEGVQVYFNLSGNGWAEKQVLRNFPPINSLSSVTVVDLLGNGTACLVWSSPLPGNAGRSMRYIELMGGEQLIQRLDGTELRLRSQKPHLLIRTINNLGAETIVQYAPSTKFYLQDWLAGKPWITKLPFPVQVVEKVTVTDKWRQTQFTSTYSYHHGYFDGIEREFRGFGRVEQTDVEDFGTFAAENAASPYIINTDDGFTLYQPLVKTITWFHTGAFLDQERILSQFQTEYFAPRSTGFTEAVLPEPDLASLDLSAEEWREALRACKGMMLRQEVYELDVDALARDEEQRVKLFSTAFHNCHIQRLQPRGDHRHAVFLVTESEAITYHYELDLGSTLLQPDPRIAHTLNLQTDEYGNVLESVAVAYRRVGQFEDPDLRENGTEALIRDVQQEQHLIYTETRYTDDFGSRLEDAEKAKDNHRLRLPCEVKTYELTGITPGSGFYYTLAALRTANLAAVLETPYHQRPDRSSRQKRLVEQVRMLYFSEDLRSPLPWGELNALALPYETYKLALTNDLLTAVLSEQLTPEIRRDLDNSELSGYLSGTALVERFRDLATQQYWVRSGIAGFANDAADHFYLPERYTDSFGNTTTLTYDRRDLYIQSSTDPVGNTTTVEAFDFRVLAPIELEDINGNRSQVYFDALGLPTAMAILGKESDRADNLAGFDDTLANPAIADLTAFFDGEVYNEAQARTWLGNATVRYVYHFGETETDWGTQPAAACSIMREQHQNPASPLQVGFEYSDGMGTVLVKKVQAEPENEGDPLRWIATGKTILNNKGKPVKQYEPYFSPNGHRFEEPMEVGVTPILYYDAAGRQIRTEMPDGTYSRVEFSPWFMATYDANDTLDADNAWYARYSRGTPAEERAARLAAIHANTPAVTHLDSLGREVVAIAHNRFQRNGTITNEKYRTYTKLDIEGKPLWIQDARNNRVMEYITPPGADVDYVPCYDIAGNLLFQHSMDGGDRWMLMDATGQPFYAWDVNERVQPDGTLPERPEQRRFYTVYDRLRRPTRQLLQTNNVTSQLVEWFVYGDEPGLFPEPSVGEIPVVQERNLRGQVYQHYDPSGVMTNQQFDFKGNLLEATRHLTQTYTEPVIDWNTETPLDETFTQRTEYDALNRMTLMENWHREARPGRTAPPPPAVYTPQYNQRGVLVSETLSVQNEARPAIQRITYNAKGQRLRINYGNNTSTTYTYDPQTFRLTQLTTTRTGGSRVYQDLHYTYDPVGNITEIRDNAQQTVYFNNTRIEPHSSYEYDALYRLIRATGREHAVQNNVQRDNTPFEAIPQIPFPNSPEALQRYIEEYVYDPVGNILSMAHSDGADLRWKRCYQYATDSNRLLATGRPSDLPNPNDPCASPYVTEPTLSQRYEYDIHGNMLTLHRTQEQYRLQWDYRDMIYSANLGGGGRAFYNYDADKQRTRKRVERLDQNGNVTRIEERIYLGGMELYRRWNANNLESLVEEIETYHLFVDDQRVLIVEDVVSTDNRNLPTDVLYRYQYGNHLGSVSMEMTGDADPQVISYEEYHPYGTTAYRGTNATIRAKAKRYRYTGMERDEETGLSYHTTRYYLPWLGRWGSCDSIGVKGGGNIYEFVASNPLTNTDSKGEQPEEATQPLVTEGLYQGSRYEASVLGALSSAGLGPERFTSQTALEFSIRTGGVTRNYRIRSDFLIRLGGDSSNRFLLLDAKASETAGLTENERIVYAEVQRAMERGERIEARVIARSGRIARRVSRISLADGSRIQIEGLQIIDPSNRQGVIENLRAATQGRSGWRTTAREQVRTSLETRGFRLSSGRSRGFVRVSRPPGSTSSPGQPTSPLMMPIAGPVIESFSSFATGALRINPEGRIQSCDVLRCTQEDRFAALRQRYVREFAEQRGITEYEAEALIEQADARIRTHGSRQRVTTIGPSPDVQDQSHQRSWMAIGRDLINSILGDEVAFRRLTGP